MHTVRPVMDLMRIMVCRVAMDTCILNTTCPAGHFRQLGVGDCEPCDDSCKSCSGAGDDECVACRDGYDILYTYNALTVTVIFIVLTLIQHLP